MKANVLSILSATSISLTNPKSSRSGFTWTGTELRHSTGGVLRFNPEITAEIIAAVATAHGGIIERKTGAEITDGNRDGWTFEGVSGDAIGYYSRIVSPAVFVKVCFAKEDLA